MNLLREHICLFEMIIMEQWKYCDHYLLLLRHLVLIYSLNKKPQKKRHDEWMNANP